MAYLHYRQSLADRSVLHHCVVLAMVLFDQRRRY